MHACGPWQPYPHDTCGPLVCADGIGSSTSRLSSLQRLHAALRPSTGGHVFSVESRAADMSIFCLSAAVCSPVALHGRRTRTSTGFISLHRLSFWLLRFAPAYWPTSLAILPVRQTTFPPNLVCARLPLWRERAWQLRPDRSSYVGIAYERK